MIRHAREEDNRDCCGNNQDIRIVSLLPKIVVNLGLQADIVTDQFL